MIKNSRAGIMFILLALVSCNRQEIQLTPKQINARADSMVAARKKAIIDQYRNDLEIRTTVEVQGKADSIVASRNKDTAAKPPVKTIDLRPDTTGKPRNSRRIQLGQEP